jgi:carboxyl-terminal processing protease
MIPLKIVKDGMMNRKKGFNLKEIIIIMVATALITSLTTGILVYNQNKLTKNLTYKDLSEDESLKEFLNVYASLIDEYYEDVDKSELLESAINAMFNYLGEDYSTYLSKEQTDSLAQKLLGEYKGIGISLNSKNEVVGFIDGGGAQESGLELGDVIIKINGTDTTNMTSSEVVALIQDVDVGSIIKIGVKRNDEELEFEVENKNIIVPAIDYKMLEDNIGYLQISTFSSTLKEQVSKALEELEGQGLNSLIIDLRDNTGGYLSAAKDVASMFLEKGKLIYSLEEKDDVKDYKDTTEEHKNYKVVLLFNESSASASEVLIAALNESYGASMVGTVSYGKGKVQQTYTLDDGSMVKYTTAKWLTPSGTCIDEVGITPDYIVEDDISTTEIDEQLNKAIEVAKQ